ncbi:LOW QUALITY PROTEIN: interleukin-13 receptor subunit alpha-1 [Morus bassanus]
MRFVTERCRTVLNELEKQEVSGPGGSGAALGGTKAPAERQAVRVREAAAARGSGRKAQAARQGVATAEGERGRRGDGGRRGRLPGRQGGGGPAPGGRGAAGGGGGGAGAALPRCGGPAAAARLGLPGRAAARRFSSGPAPATGSGSEGAAGAMDPPGGPRRARAPLRCRLLLAVCWVVAAGTAAGAKVLPPPSNLDYSFIQICTLNWTWNPPVNVSSSCDLEYSSDIVIDEVPQGKREWSKSRFRVTDTFLNKEMRFKVRSECKYGNTSKPSRWVETSLLPKGIPGTAAVDLSCVWHNLEYMVCAWRPGENASSVTNYTLFYWFDGLKNPEKCNNYSMHQGIFGCTFNLSFPKVTSTYPPISILIKDDSEEIRPLCTSKNPTTLVKPATPRRVTLSKTNGEIRVEWSEPDTFPEKCLFYEVEYHGGDLDNTQKIQVEKNYTSIPSIDPNSKYVFKVRAKPKPDCYSSELCSDWSEEKSIGEKTDSTFYFVLIITIPLIVAVSTIILLVYLKRLKILILPPIPDPREILKRMFGEQNEDSQSCAKDDSVSAYNRLLKEEEINSLILTEAPECANSEKENR